MMQEKTKLSGTYERKKYFMKEKNKKKKESLKCIDCDELTKDYYKIPTNRGNVIKCAKCYELWIWRSTRLNWNHGNNGRSNNYEE